MKHCQICVLEFEDDAHFCNQCGGQFFNPLSSSGGDIASSFTCVLKDHQWINKRMTIGGLITAIPIASAISNGYQMQVIRNLLSGVAKLLPEWDNG